MSFAQWDDPEEQWLRTHRQLRDEAPVQQAWDGDDAEAVRRAWDRLTQDACDPAAAARYEAEAPEWDRAAFRARLSRLPQPSPLPTAEEREAEWEAECHLGRLERCHLALAGVCGGLLALLLGAALLRQVLPWVLSTLPR